MVNQNDAESKSPKSIDYYSTWLVDGMQCKDC